MLDPMLSITREGFCLEFNGLKKAAGGLLFKRNHIRNPNGV